MPHSTPPLKATDWGDQYEVGDIVEVNCDYERKGERRHGWIRGIVVQVDTKMIAVQFHDIGPDILQEFHISSLAAEDQPRIMILDIAFSGKGYLIVDVKYIGIDQRLTDH